MGEIARLQGDYSLAARHYEAALDIAREIKDHDDANLFLSNLCGARVGLGQFKTAVAELQELIAGIHHNWFGLSEAYRFLGEAYLGQGKAAQAFTMAQQALALASPSNLVETGRAWRVLGLAAAALGEPIHYTTLNDELCDAPTCFERSLAFFNEGESQRDRAITLWHWAQYELEQGSEELGQAMWQEAKDIFIRLNLPLMIARMENRSNTQ